MFCHAAWPVGSYSSGPPAGRAVGFRSLGGFYLFYASPCPVCTKSTSTCLLSNTVPLTDGLRHDACELVVVELAVAVEVGLAHELLRLGRRQGLTHPAGRETKASLSATIRPERIPTTPVFLHLRCLSSTDIGSKLGGHYFLLS